MPQKPREQLIIFTRYPEPGKTKTRLIPALGARGAADLQRRMTEQILAEARRLAARRPVAVEVCYAGGSALLMRNWLGTQLHFRPQCSGHIGQRMAEALAAAFGRGVRAAVLVGSDIPGITTDILQKAFEALKKRDLVFGPAKDGGYYLIGMTVAGHSKSSRKLFADINWSTKRVLSESLEAAKKLGLGVGLLETLADIDRPEDLAAWPQAAELADDTPAKKRISVIIPTLNEAPNIEATVTGLQTYRDVEIIVADGGSRDDTVAIARSLGARVITTVPSKAGQMNAGAAAASGEVLLFLHADTRLPDNFAQLVTATACQRGFCAGAFSLSIDADARALRLIEKVANWRSRRLHLPYGDQAIFLSRRLFNEIGGFADLPIMEDYELMRRLKRRGKIIILPAAVTTSARRWLNRGIVRTWLVNQAIVIGYFFGISPRNLRRWYRREKGTPSA